MKLSAAQMNLLRQTSLFYAGSGDNDRKDRCIGRLRDKAIREIQALSTEKRSFRAALA